MSGLKSKAIRIIRTLKGKDILVFPQQRLPALNLGNQGADWTIIQNGLNKNSIVYSFGIGTDISFELKLIDNFGVIVNAFDPTPSSLEWLNNQKLPDQFKTYNYGLASFDGMADFFAPDHQNHISYTLLDNQYHGKSCTIQVKKLKTIMNELGHNYIDLLKMDVEGAEYEVIVDILDCNIEIKQWLIEFHHRFKNIGLYKTKNIVKRIQSAGYKIFSISASGEEYSFIKV